MNDYSGVTVHIDKSFLGKIPEEDIPLLGKVIGNAINKYITPKRDNASNSSLESNP